MRNRAIGWMATLSRMARSLRFKMTIGVTSFIVMVSVLLSTLFVVYLEASQRDESRRMVEEAASVIGASIANAATRGDDVEVRRQLDGFLRDSRILYVIVSTPQGDLVRATDRCPADLVPRLQGDAEPGAPYQAHALPPGPDSERAEVVVPLSGTGDAAGLDAELRVGFSLRAASWQANELRWRIATITLAMIVLGTAGTMFLVGRIIGPLQELARATESIADGDMDVHVHEDSDDEVGVLARSFNRMAAQLRAAMDAERGLSRDLERRVQEKTREIGETREHLSNIVENVGASIIVADLDGTVISANTHTMHIFGTKPEFTVGRRLDEFSCTPCDRTDELLALLERAGAPRVYDARYQLDDEHELNLLITHTLLRDGRGRAAGFLQITKDITELRRMERRLVSSERLSAMGEMAGEIGHELNNYLMAIGGRAELITAALARGIDNRQLAKVQRSAGLIADQVAEMRRLTDGLLESARKETSPQAVDLNELVRSTVEFIRPQNRFDLITFDLQFSEELLPALADPQQIRQVLLNLLANAADATVERHAAGGVLRVETFRDDKDVGFLVSDDGTGIDGATRARLFEPHFTTKATGHGFGLAVCHRVVENHGGRIVVKSVPGAGATFTVRLPRTTRAQHAAAEPVSP